MAHHAAQGNRCPPAGAPARPAARPRSPQHPLKWAVLNDTDRCVEARNKERRLGGVAEACGPTPIGHHPDSGWAPEPTCGSHRPADQKEDGREPGRVHGRLESAPLMSSASYFCSRKTVTIDATGAWCSWRMPTPDRWTTGHSRSSWPAIDGEVCLACPSWPVHLAVTAFSRLLLAVAIPLGV